GTAPGGGPRGVEGRRGAPRGDRRPRVASQQGRFDPPRLRGGGRRVARRALIRSAAHALRRDPRLDRLDREEHAQGARRASRIPRALAGRERGLEDDGGAGEAVEAGAGGDGGRGGGGGVAEGGEGRRGEE